MTSKKSPSATVSPAQQRWITALESKKYKQGGGYLKQNNGKKLEYCCLGVACHIFKRKCHLNEQFEDGQFSYNYKIGSLPDEVSVLLKMNDGGERTNAPDGFYRFDGHSVKFIDKLPDSVNEKKEGLSVKHGKYTYWETLSLIDYNDGGMTFEEIALILKTYPQHYFVSGGDGLTG